MEGESTIFWFLGGFFVFILFGVMMTVLDDEGIDYEQPMKDFDIGSAIHDAVNKRGL